MIKPIISKEFYQHGDQQMEYNLVRSKRRKTSEITVDENEIIIRMPLNKSINDANKLVNSKLKWIINKQNEYKQHVPVIVKPNFMQGSTLPFLGRNYEIEIITNENAIDNTLRFEKNKFVMTLTRNSASNHDYSLILEPLYENWLRNQAKNIFEEKVDHFRKVIRVSPKTVQVKKLRNRWGSATKIGNINLNVNLIKAPEEVIDYVIIHELCHFIINRHSHHFWNLLKKYVMDYKTRIQWLEVNGRYLI